jgi:peroxiredoxin
MILSLPFIKPSRIAARLSIMLFAALVAVAAQPLQSSSRVYAQELGIAVGEMAPGGPLETLDGKAVDLSQYLGKSPAVIEFWATWCGNCKQLEPAMRSAMTKHPGVRFITVAVSVNQSVDRVKAWQKQHKLPGELLYDRKGTVSGAFDVPATSYVVVVDKTGKIVYTGVGGTQNIDAAIKKAM